MKQTLILLAGYPGTGKSYLAKLLMKQFIGFEILSPDEIKEEFWDAYGFRNEQEKEELIQKSWVEYYHRMEWKFTRGKSGWRKRVLRRGRKNGIWTPPVTSGIS